MAYSLNIQQMILYGCELEKTIASARSGAPCVVDEDFFLRLESAAKERGTFRRAVYPDLAPDRRVGVESGDLGTQGLDNGYGLLETALPPRASLSELARCQELDLHTVQAALAAEGATTINMSIHPLGRRDFESYRKQVAPKGVYRYVWYRGWDHTAGMDGRSQCSPSTSVPIEEAAVAASVIIAAGAAFIALCANSPFEEGRYSGRQESRLAIWERMFRYSRAESDRRCARFPESPFHSLAEYFNWMFGDGTTIHFVHQTAAQDYRGNGDSLILIEGNPSFLEFMNRSSWRGFRFEEIMGEFPPRRCVEISPSLRHLELLQWAQFTGARVRFQLQDYDELDPREFVSACRQKGNRSVEQILAPHLSAMWIEGRDPGANFPDAELWDEDSAAAHSIMIAPSACQAGLLRNLSAVKQYIFSHSWAELGALREAAITNGLHGTTGGVSVRSFTERILELAADGLPAQAHHYLEYFRYVLRTGRNGAVRQVEWLNRHAGGAIGKLPELVLARRVVLSSGANL